MAAESSFFHECEIKYRLPDARVHQLVEAHIQQAGFVRRNRQLPTDFVPDTADFRCREQGIVVRFRRIVDDNGYQDIILTLKQRGQAQDFQEHFEWEYTFSDVQPAVLQQINRLLKNATGYTLPEQIHQYHAAQFDQLITAVRAIFPTHRILMEKKRTAYRRNDCHALFDTLPDGMGEYLEVEAPSPPALQKLIDELALAMVAVEPLDYGEILKRHRAGQPELLRRTALFAPNEQHL